jgi:hypothetical protein
MEGYQAMSDSKELDAMADSFDPVESACNRELGGNAWNRQPIQKHELAKDACPNLDEYDQDGMVEIDGPYIPITRPRRKYKR